MMAHMRGQGNQSSGHPLETARGWDFSFWRFQDHFFPSFYLSINHSSDPCPSSTHLLTLGDMQSQLFILKVGKLKLGYEK